MDTYLGLSRRIPCSYFWLLDGGAKSRLLRIYFFAHLNVGMYNLDIIKIQETLKRLFIYVFLQDLATAYYGQE